MQPRELTGSELTTPEERRAAVRTWAEQRQNEWLAKATPEEIERANCRDRAEGRRLRARNALSRSQMLAYRRSLPVNSPWRRILTPLHGDVTASTVCHRRPSSRRAPRSRRVGGRTRARSPGRLTDEPHPEAELAGVPA
jgi:hypothetical protein